MIELLLLSGMLVLLILSENPLALYPLAILSSLTVLLVLTLVYTVVWTMVLKQENRFRTLRGKCGRCSWRASPPPCCKLESWMLGASF
jgi:hypothetical protein